jgi:hypothetical protein
MNEGCDVTSVEAVSDACGRHDLYAVAAMS